MTVSVDTDVQMEQETRSRAALRRRLAVLNSALTSDRRLRITDVGANPINVPSYNDLLSLEGCEVWGFEPADEAFAELQKTDTPGTHYLQAAVGKPGKSVFYPHPSSGLASIFPIDEDSVSLFGKARWHRRCPDPVELTLIGLDDLGDDALPKPDVLKIDIQGGELDVFRHGRSKMDSAICVVCEMRFHRIYEGEPMWGEVDQELLSQGFAFHKLEFAKTVPFANSQSARLSPKIARNQLLDGDAIYIRNLTTLAEWSDEQVIALAYCATGVIFSHDVTLVALDELVRRGKIAEDTPARYVDSLPRWMRQEEQTR